MLIFSTLSLEFYCKSLFWPIDLPKHTFAHLIFSFALQSCNNPVSFFTGFLWHMLSFKILLLSHFVVLLLIYHSYFLFQFFYCQNSYCVGFLVTIYASLLGTKLLPLLSIFKRLWAGGQASFAYFWCMTSSIFLGVQWWDDACCQSSAWLPYTFLSMSQICHSDKCSSSWVV